MHAILNHCPNMSRSAAQQDLDIIPGVSRFSPQPQGVFDILGSSRCTHQGTGKFPLKDYSIGWPGWPFKPTSTGLAHGIIVHLEADSVIKATSRRVKA